MARTKGHLTAYEGGLTDQPQPEAPTVGDKVRHALPAAAILVTVAVLGSGLLRNDHPDDQSLRQPNVPTQEDK